MADTAQQTEPPQTLEKWRPLFAQELQAVDAVITQMAQSDTVLIPQIAGHIITSGGKRLRPILTLLSAQLFGYDGKRHVNLAAAIEFIHTATLLHDDVVDQSALRRGRDTANALWGNAASVLVGDFLLSCAFQLMARDDNARVLRLLSDTSAIISEGEVMQLAAEKDVAIDAETYLAIVRAKTAQLFAAACQIGPMVTDSGEAAEQALFDYGMALGMAFQITDDVLDYAAEQEALGKEIGDDFRECKMTLPVIVAYAKGDADEQAFWQRTLGEGDQQDGDLDTAMALVVKHGALEAAAEQAKHYAAKAEAALAGMPDGAVREALMEIARFAVARVF